MALDEDGRRLFVASREPSRFIVLDSDCGKVLTSLPCVDIADEMTYDARQKRIYVAGTIGSNTSTSGRNVGVWPRTG